MDSQNLGELLAGDRIQSSPYKLLMKQDMYCEQVCITNLGRSEQHGVKLNKVVKAIRDGYHHNWIVDNLNAAYKWEDDRRIVVKYIDGFPVGLVAPDGMAYIHNHVNIEVMIHPLYSWDKEDYRIVRFTVEPFSIGHQFDFFSTEEVADSVHALPAIANITNPIDSCRSGAQKHTSFDMVKTHIPQLASGKVLFTYDVIWIVNPDLEWSNRWDVYLTMDYLVPAKVHWYSIFNTFTAILLLGAVAALMVGRLLSDALSDVESTTEQDPGATEKSQEAAGHMIHTDVFRPPSHPLRFSVCCGTGAQILCTAILIINMSSLGFLNPARRGSLLLGLITVFCVSGFLGGYVAGRLHKSFGEDQWRPCATYTAVCFPGLVACVFCLVNILASVSGSTYAAPFGVWLILAILWLGMLTPLVFAGTYFGFRREKTSTGDDSVPGPTTSEPRPKPVQPWYRNRVLTTLGFGIIPFSACYVEFFFIMASLWQGQCYYVFGFLFLVLLATMVLISELSMMGACVQYRNGDHQWWWRSWTNGGSIVIYMALYAMLFYPLMGIEWSQATSVLYFGYMTAICVGVFLMMGFVGVASSLWFYKKLFATIKVH